MKSIEFPQQTHVLGKDQPEYAPLPVHIDQVDLSIPMTACFELDQQEKEDIQRTGKLWYTQLTFGHAFQPVRLSVQNPFETAPENTVQPEAELPGGIVKAVHEAIGAASMCWEFPEKAGVFKSEQTSEIARKLCEIIKAELNKPL